MPCLLLRQAAFKGSSRVPRERETQLRKMVGNSTRSNITNIGGNPARLHSPERHPVVLPKYLVASFLLHHGHLAIL